MRREAGFAVCVFSSETFPSRLNFFLSCSCEKNIWFFCYLLCASCFFQIHIFFIPNKRLTMSDDDKKAEIAETATAADNGSEFSHLRHLVCSIVPSLSDSNHKGQSGRIGIIGGSREYTGAPYFAALSALKVGGDLSYVFSTADAATVIKTYSPELIVYPVLDSPDGLEEMIDLLPRMHSIVIGPGLGRKESLLSTVAAVINKVKELDIPLVLGNAYL